MGKRSGLQNLQSRRMNKGRNWSSISEIKSEIPPCEPPKVGSKAGPVPPCEQPLAIKGCGCGCDCGLVKFGSHKTTVLPIFGSFLVLL